MRRIDEIIIHCAATRADWMEGRPLAEKVAEIRRWHVNPPNNWVDIGYHYIVDRDGKVAAGRPEHAQGAHCRGRNEHSIGICLIGGHGSAASDDPLDNFTGAQLTAARKLIADIQARNQHATKISGHNEYANKACPGFNVPKWHKGQKPREKPAQSTTVQASATQIGTAAAGAAAAIGGLDGTAQIIAIVGCILVAGLAAWIMRERLRSWSRGWR